MEVERVFGPGVSDADVREKAIASRQQFVRNQTQVGIWNERATGRVLTAFECLYAFGRPTMALLAEHEVVPFVPKGGAVGPIIGQRSKLLSAEPKKLAARLARDFAEVVTADDLTAMQAGKKKIPVRLLTKLSRILALDSWKIGSEAANSVDPGVAAKLRSVTRARPVAGSRLQTIEHLGPDVALELAEAFWMIATQETIAAWLGVLRARKPESLAPKKKPADRAEAYEQGRALAGEVRTMAGLSKDEPIADVVALCEDILGVPVIRARLDTDFAGAALATADHRGIVANVTGINDNPGTFRITVAHELCHIVCDDLAFLHVDVPAGVEDAEASSPPDVEEARAQAFASELLAPREAAYALYRAAPPTVVPLGYVMDRLGVSYTCAYRQTALIAKNDDPNFAFAPGDAATLTRQVFAGSSRWREHDMAGKRIASRRFDTLCKEARERNMISADTFAELTSFDAKGLAIEPKKTAALLIGSETNNKRPASRQLSEQEWTILYDVYVRTSGNRRLQAEALAEASAFLQALAKGTAAEGKNFRPPDGLRDRLKAFEDLEKGGVRRKIPDTAVKVFERYRYDLPSLTAAVELIRARAHHRL